MDGCGGEEEMEDRRELEKEEKKEKDVVLMWGYLPGVSPDRLPLLHPVPVRRPESANKDAWRDVSGGGCGFAMAISGVSSATLPFSLSSSLLDFTCLLFVNPQSPSPICFVFNCVMRLFVLNNIK
ncbi:hypothetical protein KSP39_PZI018392 [Platanthera zijinensis]|uniref:Uncharacterized protein n=1 Tax=Platanthera zijinensis TaxID=2320716 RepID=A0AAP0B4M8_9ASPA